MTRVSTGGGGATALMATIVLRWSGWQAAVMTWTTTVGTAPLWHDRRSAQQQRRHQSAGCEGNGLPMTTATGNSKSGWDDKGSPQDQADDGGERLERSPVAAKKER
jgi:hypothetical protein